MKTTEMIAKVKDAQNFLIVNELGHTIRTDTMRDLGYVLYTIIDNVKHGDTWYLCNAKNLNLEMNEPVLILTTADLEAVGPASGDRPTINDVTYSIESVHPLEFDSFGELENWSHVSEEDATQLLTKAPAEPVQIEGTDLFKQVFDLLELRYTEYYQDNIDDESAYYKHFTEDRWVDIMFDKGLVQVGHGNTCEPPRKLKISFA